MQTNYNVRYLTFILHVQNVCFPDPIWTQMKCEHHTNRVARLLDRLLSSEGACCSPSRGLVFFVTRCVLAVPRGSNAASSLTVCTVVWTWFVHGSCQRRSNHASSCWMGVGGCHGTYSA